MADRRSDSLARSLLLAYVQADPNTIARLIGELDDPDNHELALLVLDRIGRVSATLLSLIGARAGINVRRAVEDSFTHHGPIDKSN